MTEVFCLCGERTYCKLVEYASGLVLNYREIKEQASSEFAHVNLSGLAVIKTLGVGGFGRVELVTAYIYNFCMVSLSFLTKIKKT